jgi:hypothetical protein
MGISSNKKDWVIIIFIFFIAIVAAGFSFFGIYTFITVRHLSNSDVVKIEGNISKISRNEILEYIDQNDIYGYMTIENKAPKFMLSYSYAGVTTYDNFKKSISIGDNVTFIIDKKSYENSNQLVSVYGIEANGHTYLTLDETNKALRKDNIWALTLGIISTAACPFLIWFDWKIYKREIV